MNRSIENKVDAHREPLGPKHILEALEKIQIDFDAKGRPKFPTIVMHPDALKSYKDAIDALEKTPDLKAKFDALIAGKKEDWRARESHRKLVG